MADRRGNLILLLGSVGLILMIVSVVLPWWSVSGGFSGASGEQTAAPFNTGGMGDGVINAVGVDAVGVLSLFGIVSATGGLVLYLAAYRRREEPAEPAPWLLIAGGALYIIGPVVAVVAWPEGDLGFWSSASAGAATFETAAAVGWYLAMVAGALAGAGGIAGMEPPEETEQDRGPVEPEPEPEPEPETGPEPDPEVQPETAS